MQQHSFLQGSPEWHAHRATSRNASDAPAVLGCSAYQTRSELLHARHTGLRPEVTADQERRFAAGHDIEAAQVPGAEEVIGESLYPVVGSAVVDGIELSASFDGLTMLEDTAYECKTLNDTLRSAFADMETIAPEHRERAAGKCLPKMYQVQMEQQLAVCGGERVLFVAATKDGSDVRRCWYYPDPALRAEILAGWKQFDADLAAYVPPAASAVERLVAEPVQALPSVSVRVEGQIVIHENFDVFEVAMRDFLEHRLIREPKTDQHFADLEVQIKAMKGAEAALDNAESSWIAQIETVAEKKCRKDMLRALVRDNRLMAEKLLASEKERRRGEIVTGGVKAIQAHIDGLNTRLGGRYMPAIVADFAGCLRGLKSLTSMEDKVSTLLANLKIEANATADRIDANLKHLREHAADYRALFPDTTAIVLKAPEDLQALVTARISEHRVAEERRAAQLAERERARIRQEEEARAQRLAQEKAAAEEAERQRVAADQRRQEAARLDEEARQRFAAANPPIAQPAAAPANVHPMPTRAPAAPVGEPTLRLGQINERIAPLSIDAAGLAALGFNAAVVKNARLFHEADFPAIVTAMVARLTAVRDQRRVA